MTPICFSTSSSKIVERVIRFLCRLILLIAHARLRDVLNPIYLKLLKKKILESDHGESHSGINR